MSDQPGFPTAPEPVSLDTDDADTAINGRASLAQAMRNQVRRWLDDEESARRMASILRAMMDDRIRTR